MPVIVVIVIAAIYFVGVGVVMQSEVALKEARLHEIQAEYFGTPKSIRDSAAAGSILLDQLVEIQQTPSQLLELKLVGIGKILTGISLLLLGIMIALVLMPIRLARMINTPKK